MRDASNDRVERHDLLVRTRSWLPSPRAAAGGLLVAASALGSWGLSATAHDTPGTPTLVAAGPIAPGHVITAADVTVVLVDLPHAQRDHTLRALDEAVGQVALGPVGAGEFLQPTSVSPAAEQPGARSVSFVVEQPWAVDGALVAGDHIDLLSTWGEGVDATTERVLRDATVARVSHNDGGGLGGVSTLTITVVLTDQREVEATATAAHIGAITVVRATGAGGP